MPTANFDYTGAQQTWVVPAGVSEVTVEAWGAEGSVVHSSYSAGGQPPGKGGYAKGTLAVTPGETLYVYVGQSYPTPDLSTTPGGWPDGSSGQNGNASGGGSSDVRQGGNALANRRVVAGGGGGGGRNISSDTTGGVGGGGGGEPGSAGANRKYSAAGTGGRGGTAGVTYGDRNGPGGGGGYGIGEDGAGENTYAYGGGGGGSGYIGGVTGGTMTTGIRSGHGAVVLSYNRAPTAPTLGSPAADSSVGNTGNITFTWTHSDPDGDAQNGYSLRRSIDAGATWEYWTGSAWTGTATWVTSSSQSVAIPGGTFEDGQAYTWSVATRDPAGLTGPYATARTLNITDEPSTAPTLISPSNASTVSDSVPITFDWTFNDPGDTQSAFVLRRKRRP